MIAEAMPYKADSGKIQYLLSLFKKYKKGDAIIKIMLAQKIGIILFLNSLVSLLCRNMLKSMLKM
jgi:hypothetical protein